MPRCFSGGSSTNARSSPNTQVQDLPVGTTVLLREHHQRLGKLTRSSLIDGAGQALVQLVSSRGDAVRGPPISQNVADMALPLTDWPKENFLNDASAPGGGTTLNLPKGTVVVLDASEYDRGTVVEVRRRAPSSSTPSMASSDVLYNRVAYNVRNHDTAKTYLDVAAKELAVPLENWLTHWPSLPSGTILFYHNTTPRDQCSIANGIPSSDGLYDLAHPGGRLYGREPLHDLILPFTSWSMLDRFETGQPGYPHLPAGMKVLVGARKAARGALRKTGAFGTYEVAFPEVGCLQWNGMELGVSLEVCLHLHQIEAMKSEISQLKENEKGMAAVLEQQKAECEKAEERIAKVIQGNKLMLSATSEHDYGSSFPSPTDLVGKIGRIEDQLFTQWVVEAVGNAGGTWMLSEGAAKAVASRPRDFVLQVLVETVRECHDRVQESVSARTSLLGSFAGGAKDRLADDIAIFERTAFVKGYKEMFVDLCPASADGKTQLAQGIFRGLPACASVSEKSPTAPPALFDSTREAYEEIVESLLAVFLECEITRSAPLRFSDTFASTEPWNPDEHNKDTFDPSDEGEKLVPGETHVQVVIPRLSWEKIGANGEKRPVPETKASFVKRGSPEVDVVDQGEGGAVPASSFVT